MASKDLIKGSVSGTIMSPEDVAQELLEMSHLAGVTPDEVIRTSLVRNDTCELAQLHELMYYIFRSHDGSGNTPLY